MRFSEAWLREWVNPPVDTAALADQLSMAGLEVDAINPAAPPFQGVRIGLVQQVEPHPDAAKLRICRVDLGQGEPLQIICGAANVAAGQRVPVATLGALLPGGLKIKRAKLRGVESHGMICSAVELGLAETADGILPLPADAPLGQDFRAWLGLDDACIELDLTPDRGDCLSLAGVAREVGVINRVPVCVPPLAPVAATRDDRFPVELLAPAACPRYACRVVRNIDPTAETPLWMRERLRRAGLRPIHPVVDVTNYVLLELGQPLHGFDLAKLKDGIRVRLANPGEPLALLNGETVELTADTLVIADADQAVALAGIMGGASTAVSAATRDILFESAFFAPTHISGKARRYGLHTDASHRFERGVDPELQVRALERATSLLLAISGGEPGPIVEAVIPDQLPARQRHSLRRERIRRLLGLSLDDEAIADILTRLGMELTPTAAGWEVLAPSSRFDLVHEVDIIAEIGRIHGYTRIPASHASASSATKAPPETAFDLDRARLALVDRGYHEVITYSFVSPELQARLDPDQRPLLLANPLSPDLSAMRTSLWPGLLQAARGNLARQQGRLRFFESGLRFRQDADGLRQEPLLAGLILGSASPEQWGETGRASDFYDLKADVEALLALTGAPGAFRFLPDEHPALHPGQTARIVRQVVPETAVTKDPATARNQAGTAAEQIATPDQAVGQAAECIRTASPDQAMATDQTLGLIGMLHPALAAELDIAGNAYLFELDLTRLRQGLLPAFSPISRFPAIRRDLALLVDRDLPYQRLRDTLADAAGDLLRDLILFDVYEGERLPPGTKSFALGLILQATSQTLTDQEVETTLSRILQRLRLELGAKLRD